MPPAQKKFVKYTFEQGRNKIDETKNVKNKQVKQSRQNFKQKDSNVNTKTKRHSYLQKQKSTSKQNVLSEMINTFVLVSKPTKQIQQLLKSFPKYFSSTPKQPEPYSSQTLNGFLILLGKKPQRQTAKHYAPIQQEQQQDPSWDSSSDVQGGIQSKKIDENVVQKIQQKYMNIKQLRNDQLKRHQKQFLQDYYRQKHQQQLQKQQNNGNQENKQAQNKQQGSLLEQTSNNFQSDFNQWTDYQEKQVNEFVNMGFIQKIQGNQQQEFNFSQEDFSMEDQKSQKQKQSQSSSQDDDQIFGDVGPTTIVKKKQITHQDKITENSLSGQTQGTVVINHHVFSRIAELAGIPPGACIWIIRNKNQRYKVTTQFMDQMYRLNKICDSLPYISLNHSQFVHNHDVQKQRSIDVFKRFNARKKFTNNNNQQGFNKSSSKNYPQQQKKKLNYKPGTKIVNQKGNLNKK